MIRAGWLPILIATLLHGSSVAQVAEPLALPYVDMDAGIEFPADEARLESIRASGDLPEQRRHAWRLFAAATRPISSNEPLPRFLTWFGMGEVFVGSQRSVVKSIVGRELKATFSVPKARPDVDLGNQPPLIIRAHYNFTAYRHIVENRLDNRESLMSLPSAESNGHAGGRAIPEFPRDAVVIKTAWWPIPAEGTVALPVWDSSSNPAQPSGNDYPTWARVVAVSAESKEEIPASRVDIEFMGRTFKGVQRVELDALYHIVLDEQTAAEVMKEPLSSRAAQMVLGRSLRANDSLALVAMHLATREIKDWVWTTFWWHDAANSGPYSTLRPRGIEPPWSNYLMNVAFDAELPRETDGSAHVAFNPWLEARFPNSGAGGGVVSNCASCHSRASTALIKPFVVTRRRAVPDLAPDGSRGDLTTSSLWSIPMQAQ